MKTLTLSDSAFAELAACFNPAGAAPGPTTSTVVVPDGYQLMSVTGHIVQRPVDGDFSYSGYVIRTAPVNRNGSETWTLSWHQWVEANGGRTPTRADWPEILDRYLNIDAYDPGGAAARALERDAKAKQQWVAVDSMPMAEKTDTI